MVMPFASLNLVPKPSVSVRNGKPGARPTALKHVAGASPSLRCRPGLRYGGNRGSISSVARGGGYCFLRVLHAGQARMQSPAYKVTVNFRRIEISRKTR